MGKLFGIELDPGLELMLDGMAGGQRGLVAVRATLQAGAEGIREATERAKRAETALALAQAQLRALQEPGTVMVVAPEAVAELRALATVTTLDEWAGADAFGELAAAVLRLVGPE